MTQEQFDRGFWLSVAACLVMCVAASLDRSQGALVLAIVFEISAVVFVCAWGEAEP